jgi:hypothetical protein
MSRNPGYEYSHLEDGSIRLLQIEAVSKTPLNGERDAIRCRIQHSQFHQAPISRALSYAWGSFRTDIIYLNDRRVEVRSNLWHLRAANFCGSDLAINYKFTHVICTFFCSSSLLTPISPQQPSQIQVQAQYDTLDVAEDERPAQLDHLWPS